MISTRPMEMDTDGLAAALGCERCGDADAMGRDDCAGVMRARRVARDAGGCGAGRATEVEAGLGGAVSMSFARAPVARATNTRGCAVGPAVGTGAAARDASARGRGSGAGCSRTGLLAGVPGERLVAGRAGGACGVGRGARSTGFRAGAWAAALSAVMGLTGAASSGAARRLGALAGLDALEASGTAPGARRAHALSTGWRSRGCTTTCSAMRSIGSTARSLRTGGAGMASHTGVRPSSRGASGGVMTGARMAGHDAGRSVLRDACTRGDVTTGGTAAGRVTSTSARPGARSSVSRPGCT
jgi:hypothetical protein